MAYILKIMSKLNVDKIVTINLLIFISPVMKQGKKSKRQNDQRKFGIRLVKQSEPGFGRAVRYD